MERWVPELIKARWRRGGPPWGVREVRLVLRAEQWLVCQVAQVHHQPVAAADEADARRLAEELMCRLGGVWESIEPYPTEAARRRHRD